jgi:type IV pilus assembly protein PilN
MIRINLLPHRQELESKRGRLQLFFVVLPALCIAVALFIVNLSFSSILDRQRRQLNELGLDEKELKEQMQDLEELKKTLADLDRKMNLIRRLEKGKRGPVRLLDDIARAMPKRVWLTELEELGNKIVIRGRALGATDVPELMKKLERSAYLQNIQLGETSRGEEFGIPIYNFDITAFVDYVES